MSEMNLEYWNKRYIAGDFPNQEPDPFLVSAEQEYLRPLLAPGSTGLDLAGGAGRQAFWLARQGWRMTLVDFAPAAIARVRERNAGLPAENRVEVIEEPMLDWILRSKVEGRRFRFVLVAFFLDRAVLPHIAGLVEPGGVLLYRTYTADNERLGNPRGPRNPEFLVRSQELLEEFHGMRILFYKETVAEKGIVELIAQCEEG